MKSTPVKSAGELPALNVTGITADLKALRANPRLKGRSWRSKMIQPKRILK